MNIENNYTDGNFKPGQFNPAFLLNLKPVLEQVLAGNPDARNRPEFTCLNLKSIQAALDWLANNELLGAEAKADLALNSWRLTYRSKPPTPEEFLTPKYIGSMAESLYPHIKKAFIEFMDPMKPYRTVVLYSCIGSGKSTVTVLVNLYLAVLFAYMWAPYRYFGLAVSTQFVMALCGTSQKKASELLVEPMLNVLESTEFFQKCRTKADMIKEEQEFIGGHEIDHINWTTAVPTSVLSTSNGLNFKQIGDANGILGAAQPLDEPVKLPDGSWTTMGLLKPGDKIASPLYGSTEIKQIFPQGKVPCYKITLASGRSTRCSYNHQWTVAWEKDSNNNWIFKTVSTQFIIDNFDKYDFYIPDPEDLPENFTQN